jgi:hypothetical protein
MVILGIFINKINSMNLQCAFSRKPNKVIFFIGDFETEEVEINTLYKNNFIYTNANTNIKINKNTYDKECVKYEKNSEDFTNIFTWFVYKMFAFF